jgi:CheY-like chemotaxis protein
LTPSRSDVVGVNVLLVDDAIDSLELAATIVRLRGARAAVASSSSEAMALLRDLPIDVLVSDIAMPNEDGCSLIRRAHELRPGLRAAALSAHAHLEDRERALAAGFETYLTKPIDPETLARTVRSLAHPMPARSP